MKISEQVRRCYKKWEGFLNEEVEFTRRGGLHTKEHCARVLLFALLIAEALRLPEDETEALCAAAVFHDSRRLDDGFDVGHGARAAEYYREFCASHKNIRFDARCYDAIRFHDRNDAIGEAEINAREPKEKNGAELYRAFKDADALDRFRLGPGGLDVRHLRTEAAKSLAGFAEQLWRSGVSPDRL